MGSAYSNIVKMPVATPNEVVLGVTPLSSGSEDAIEYSNTLAWNSISGASQEVWRQINNGIYTRIAQGLSGSATSFVDQAPSGAFAQGQYDYYIRVLDSDGNEVGLSNIASVTWPRGDENPLELNIAQSTSTQGSSVYALNTLTWNDINAYTYTIFRKVNQQPVDSITQVGDGTFQYVDQGLKDSPSFPAGQYSYYVVGADYNGVPIATSPTEVVSWS